MLKRYRLAAVVAQHGGNRIARAALRTGLLFGGVRVYSEDRAARTAIGSQVIEPFELPALALPVSDRVFDELELRSLSKICNRKYRAEHRLETGVLALGRKKVHLKKAIIRLSLNLNEVRYSDRRLDPGKIVSLAAYAVTCIS